MLRDAITRNCKFIEHDIPLSWVLSNKFFKWLPVILRRAAQPLLRIILFPFQYLRLRRIFYHIDGDSLLVINGAFPGGETCRIANIVWYELGSHEQRGRNIHNFHNYAVAPRPGLGWFENWIDRLLSKSVGRMISVSSSCAESLRIRSSFQSSTIVGHIYNGLSLNLDEPVHGVPNLRYELGIGNAPLCLMLANFEPRKGHRFLFDAFARVTAVLPEAHLVVCGGGSTKEKILVDLLRRNLAPNANIHLLDFIPNGASLIQQADLVTISSQSFESFGLTALEAMIRGVPVVSTLIGGLPEVLGENGNGGYLAAVDDPAAFSELILQLLRDSELRRQVGEQGRKRASLLFTANRMADEYHKVLTSETIPIGPSEVPRLRGEWYHLLRRCIKPVMALETFVLLAFAIRRRLGNRILRRRDKYYPPMIKTLAIFSDA